MVGGIYQLRSTEAAALGDGACKARDGAFLLEGFPEGWTFFVTSEFVPEGAEREAHVYWEVTAVVPRGVVPNDFERLWKACLDKLNVALEGLLVYFPADEEEAALRRSARVSKKDSVMCTGTVDLLREAIGVCREQERAAGRVAYGVGSRHDPQ